MKIGERLTNRGTCREIIRKRGVIYQSGENESETLFRALITKKSLLETYFILIYALIINKRRFSCRENSSPSPPLPRGSEPIRAGSFLQSSRVKFFLNFRFNFDPFGSPTRAIACGCLSKGGVFRERVPE